MRLLTVAPPRLVFRIGIMVSSASLAAAFGGLLASGLIAAGQVGSIGAPWRNIFVFEGECGQASGVVCRDIDLTLYVTGLITMVLAVAVYFVTPNQPETAWFLSKEERGAVW
jgi:hypothetical protein